jgi:hypothetical protein
LRSSDWLLPHPSPPSPVSKLSVFLSLPVCHLSSFLTGEAGGCRGGAKSYDHEKALPLLIIQHSLVDNLRNDYSAESILLVSFIISLDYSPFRLRHGVTVWWLFAFSISNISGNQHQ